MGITVPSRTATDVATTMATAASVSDRRPEGTARAAAGIAIAADGSASRSPSARTGPTTCPGEAPRLRARDIVVRRRRAARIAINARVATATRAGPTATTAKMDSAALQRAWCDSSSARRPVRSAVSLDAVTLADG